MAPELRSRKHRREQETLEQPAFREQRAAQPSPLGGLFAFVVAIVVAVIILRLVSPRPQLFTAEELARYNGAWEDLPIYLSILGSVFDVSSGKSHYGKGGGYHHFAGRDATRAFVTGNFTGEGLSDSVDGLSPLEMKSIGDWRIFYHRTYNFVGKLVGRYYDSAGKPTGNLTEAERGIKLGEEQEKLKAAEEKKFPTCNSRWSDADGGEVWCSSGYPRRTEDRCACFEKTQLNRPKLQVYPGCHPSATTCKTS